MIAISIMVNAMLHVGALVKQDQDSELYLVRGGLSSADRVRLQRWSDGAVRSVSRDGLTLLTPVEAAQALRSKVLQANRRYALLNDNAKAYNLSFQDEITLYVVNYKNVAALQFRVDFIRELAIAISAAETLGAPYVSYYFVVMKVQRFLLMVGLEPPSISLVMRRLRCYSKSILMQSLSQ
ncbi:MULTISPECIES: hypothetical protein [Pseudomonas]|nr:MULTISPECIES: hypothetical protein [Pseudomonas]MBF8807019.1 hypothetical protein [Pseudomonas asiatica]MCE0881702.1 hypothetical protein [Pseudomonas putida]